MRTLTGAVGLAVAAAISVAGCSGTNTGNSVIAAGSPPSTSSSASPSSQAPSSAARTSAPPPSSAKPAPAPTTPPPTRAPTPAAAAPAPAAPAAPATRAPAAQPPVPAAPPAAPVAPAPAPLVNAEAVVTQYYQDITDHDYAAAWALGGSNITGGESYSQYVAGFATTAAISLGTVSEFGSDQVSAVLYATQTDGTLRVFDGTYTVSGGVLVGASIARDQ
ncbi:hypothetical protein [Streptacidiphilus sp. PAMC 29251]